MDTFGHRKILEIFMELIRLKINNWEKYNPRNDIKSPKWFALNNRILEDPHFFGFTSDEFKFWIYALCQASQQNSEEILINVDHAKHICSIESKIITSATKKLSAIECIQVLRGKSVRDPNVSVQIRTNPYATLQDKTLQNRTSIKFFSFDEVFQEFKALCSVKGPKAEDRFHSQIKTEKDFEDIKKAIANYKDFLSLPENDWRQPKQSFATFLGTKSTGYFWRDFIEAPEKEADLGWTKFID